VRKGKVGQNSSKNRLIFPVVFFLSPVFRGLVLLAAMNPSSYDWHPSQSIYVGNLTHTVVRRELERTFGQYGRVKRVWMPGFAYVEFFSQPEAAAAVREMNGVVMAGSRVVVDFKVG